MASSPDRYILSLSERLILAERQRRRYWSDDTFRLRCINRDRARKGKPPLASLAEMEPSRRVHRRDESGRFV